MKAIETTKHYEALLLKGSKEKSYHLYRYEQERASIEAYRVWYWDGRQENAVVIASNETEHQFSLLLNRKKARAVIQYLDQRYILDNKDSKPERKSLQGAFFLIWKEHMQRERRTACGLLVREMIHIVTSIWIFMVMATD